MIENAYSIVQHANQIKNGAMMYAKASVKISLVQKRL